MANTIGEGDRNLVRLDYTSLLTAILEALQNPQANNPYKLSESGQQLCIDIDNIAYSLATNQGSKIQMPLSSSQGARIATTNFTESSRDDFANYNRQIRDCLQQLLESFIRQHGFDSIESYIKTLLTNLSEFQGKVGNEISFDYDFNKQYQGLSKQRLTLKHEDNDYPLLKFHRLTISIKDTKDKFDLQLRESIENYIKRQFDTNSNKDELEEILEDLYTYRDDTDSDWYAIKRLMDTEAIAKVQRTAKIKYLEYLLEHIGEHSEAIHLEILIHRLKELERYIDDPERTDGDYQVSYNSESFNIKELFSRSESFDRLPIIPIIDGSLGESRDDNKGELNFTFGLKLKFGGEIQTEGAKTVLEYNLDLLDHNSQRHQEELANESKKVFCARRTIQIAVLYFFVFAGNNPLDPDYNASSDLDYDVTGKFEQSILPILKGSDENAKCGLFKGIIKGINQYNTEGRIGKLRSLLKSQIKRSQLWSSRAYPIQINVKKGILETDANAIDERNTFFRDGITQKSALKYISVSNATIDPSSVCYFSGDIKISEIGYFNTNDNQAFSMEYRTGKFPTIPIVVYPEKSTCMGIVNKNLRDRRLIQFPYQPERLQQNIFNGTNSTEAFIYRFVFSLLSHISTKTILDIAINKINARLFVPILMLHLGDKNDPLDEEVFMRANFASLSHLINSNHRSSTQGFSVNKINQYKMRNALSSLYNVLPKKFILKNNPQDPKIDKLAIVVVSSRECDRSWQGNYKIANLTGEVIKLDRQDDGSILVYTSKTISNHYDSRQIYQDPDILVREVDRLYQEGYKHILYIAKSPYSQTLNLTATEEEDNLYFMSSPVIRNLKGNKEDLKIYPVFFDKYFVVSLQNTGRKSLYIQDAEELTNIVDDPSKKVAVFFNLFNGIQVGKSEDRYYNGVISYSTLLNVYDQNLLDTGEIYADLINNDHEQGLKTEILQLLTLFHFSRYEADIGGIQLKLDPYQNIIGDKSVGALSIFPHMQSKVQFNLLAFLNEVDDALNANIKPQE
jgi:hypothetical protein